MFGNKYAGADIAAEMYKLLNDSKSDSRVKTASEEETEESVSSLKAEATVRPEDFLVAPETGAEDVGASLDGKISDMSSRADDLCPTHSLALDSCGCPKSSAQDGMSAGSLLAESLADDVSRAEDISYLIDARAKAVLEGLGKVAKSLHEKNEAFAADLVEATAMGIRQDYLEKAAKKIKVIDSLTKMASEFYSNGNDLAGDMVTVTIGKIKKRSSRSDYILEEEDCDECGESFPRKIGRNHMDYETCADHEGIKPYGTPGRRSEREIEMGTAHGNHGLREYHGLVSEEDVADYEFDKMMEDYY